jgi:hypothetical protein
MNSYVHRNKGNGSQPLRFKLFILPGGETGFEPQWLQERILEEPIMGAFFKPFVL